MGAFFMPVDVYAKGNSDDSVPPTVSTELVGEMLHIQAEDDDSGVDAVYIGGKRVNYREGNAVELDFTDFVGTEDKAVEIYAVDFAGNRSEVTEILNPYYSAAKGTASEKKTITPDGQATVADAVTDEDGKEFYTFITPEENVFYLVIDKERDTDNVYFLNAVTETDLLALAEKAENDKAGSGNENGNADGNQNTAESIVPEIVVCTCMERCEAGAVDVSCQVCRNDLTSCTGKENKTTETEEAERREDKKENGGMYVFVLAAALAVGGAGYYFKIYKPKHDLDDAEDLEDLLDDEDEREVNEDEQEVKEDTEENGQEVKEGTEEDGQEVNEEAKGYEQEAKEDTPEEDGDMEEQEINDLALYDDYLEDEGPDDEEEGEEE